MQLQQEELIQVEGTQYTEAQRLKRTCHIRGDFCVCELFRGGSQEMKLEKFIEARYGGHLMSCFKEIKMQLMRSS